MLVSVETGGGGWGEAQDICLSPNGGGEEGGVHTLPFPHPCSKAARDPVYLLADR